MLVLLDIGSTLIEGPTVGPGKRLAQELGLSADLLTEINNVLFRTPLRDPDSLSRLLVDVYGVDADKSRSVSEELWYAQLRESYVLPGAKRLIDELDSQGVTRAYISNIWVPFYSGFERFFPDEVRKCRSFLSFELGMSKPDIYFYEFVLREMGVSPQDVVMIGDTYTNDMAPAINLGMKTVWVLHRPSKEKKEIIGVINRTLPAPLLTVDSIGDLNISLLEKVYGREYGV